MAESRSWLPQTESGVLLVTASEYLKDEVARIAAAAAVPLTMVPRLQDAPPADGRILLVGSDQASAGSLRPGPMILAGTADEGELLWEQAARLGAGRVAVLPEAAAWLAEYLSRSAGRNERGHIVGLAGAVGGAGTSTLSCWLAHAAGEQGHAALLVDGDPWGGGLELALGAERVPGVRWQDVGQVRGSLNPLQLVQALPAVAGFALLSWASAGGTGPETQPAHAGAVRAVMESAGRAHRVTVVDLGRAWLADPTLLSCCDSLVLVVPAHLRAVMAGRQLASALASLPLSVAVRGPFGADLDEQVVADALGLPLAGLLPQLRGVRTAADTGQVLAQGRRRAVRRLTREILAGLSLPPGTGEAA